MGGATGSSTTGGADPQGSWGRRYSSAAGWWRVPLGRRDTVGGAPRPLSLCHPRKIPQTAAEGLPSPPPWGSCSPCSCCSSTPAPAGTRCPRPPAFSPPRLPPPTLFSFKLHLHPLPRPGGVGAMSPPLPRGPPRCRPALPTGRSQRRVGVQAGAPRQSGDGDGDGAPALRPPGCSDSKAASAPSAHDPPPIHLAYIF